MKNIDEAIAYLKEAVRRGTIEWWEIAVSSAVLDTWHVEICGVEGMSKMPYRVATNQDPLRAAIEAVESL